jgi:HEAT repeat protein
VAYHFKRSPDRQKAIDYDNVQTAANARNFDPHEALYYTLETPVESAVVEVPLKSDDLDRIPKFLRLFMVALRNVRLYPSGSKSIVNANNKIKRVIERILAKNDTLSILRLNQAILVNGQKLNLTEYKLIADAFLQFLNRFELQGIAFHKGLSAKELEIVLLAFGKTKQKMFEPKHWQHFSAENRLHHIELKQTHYAIKAKSKGVFVNPVQAPPAAGGNAAPAVADALPQKPLGPQELNLIPEILRGLIGASKTVKLYSTDSTAATTAVKNLMGTLRRFFHWQPFVTISQTGTNLLVNGEKVDISGITDFSGVVVGFLKFLDDLGVENLTILKQVTQKQMDSFLNAFAEMPTAGAGTQYWEHVSGQRGLSTILFDQHQYEIQMPQNLAGQSPGILVVQGQVPISNVPVKTPAIQKNFNDLLAEFPDNIQNMFLKDDQAGIQRAVFQLFEDLEQRQPPDRKKAIEVCEHQMNTLDLSFQHDAIRFFVDPLLMVLHEEKEPKIVAESVRLMIRMVAQLIQFVDYSLASRIINNFQKRYRELKAANDSRAFIFAKIIENGLDSQTQKLVVEDLKSDDPSRQQPAAHLLGGLGRAVLPQLIDIIKKEDNYRVRHTAATLLGRLGPKAVQRLKRSMVLEISPNERKRILEILDTITVDVTHELIFGIGDEDPKVREAAYGLAERIKDRQTTNLLLDFAKHHNGALAAGAIKCLGKLEEQEVETELIALLNSSTDEQLCIACCRALGQIAKPTSIKPLAAMLMPKRLFFFRKKRSAQLRAAAALALRQIPDQRAADHLANFVDDNDPRVREIARNSLDSSAAVNPAVMPKAG